MAANDIMFWIAVVLTVASTIYIIHNMWNRT